MFCAATSSKRLARMGYLVLTALILAGISGPARAAEYFIDPNGSPTGAGTIGDPWDLYKLDDSTAASGGDTIYLRGGTYYYPLRDDGQQGFKMDVRGSAGNKILIQVIIYFVGLQLRLT